MVVSLGPGKFYGSSLPRPRFTKFNEDRVDPPLSVLDPLLSWAHEAHWSMGGLSFQRLRLQGRIEGNVNKLRRQREKSQKKSPEKDSITYLVKSKKRAASVSPPPAPVASKRRRYLALSEDEDQSDAEYIQEKKKEVARRGAARKLGDDFERVAKESGGLRGRNGNGIGTNIMKIVQEINDEEEIAVEKKVKKVLKNGNGVVQSRSSPKTSSRQAKQSNLSM